MFSGFISMALLVAGYCECYFFTSLINLPYSAHFQLSNIEYDGWKIESNKENTTKRSIIILNMHSFGEEDKKCHDQNYK